MATHRSKVKCGGSTLVHVNVPDEFAATAAASGSPAAQPNPANEDAVVVEGKPAVGKLVEPRGVAPTTFRGQTEATAELRAYFDYFRATLKYESDFSTWLEEMTRLAIRELFGMELVMRVRERAMAGTPEAAVSA